MGSVEFVLVPAGRGTCYPTGFPALAPAHRSRSSRPRSLMAGLTAHARRI